MRSSPSARASVIIRPICSDDRDLIVRARDYTSQDTYYRRFHAVKPTFSDRELSYLTEVDGEDHVALIATDPGDPGRLIAVARYIRAPRGGDEAEIAIVVHDPYQRRGVGRQMLGALVTEARGHGIVRLRALIQIDNHAMIALLRDALPQTMLETIDGSTADYVADIGPAPLCHAAPALRRSARRVAGGDGQRSAGHV